MKLKKLAITVFELLLTFLIKIYIMNVVQITGNNTVDKIIFSFISIVLIIFIIKNFIDISISKKEKIKLSVWLQLCIFIAFVIGATIIWFLMNYELFWIIIGALVISYVILFFKNYKELQVEFGVKQRLKKAVVYHYGLKISKIKPLRKGNISVYEWGKDEKYHLLVAKCGFIDENKINEILKIEDLNIIQNEDDNLISNIKNYYLVIISNASRSLILRAVGKIQDCD